MLKKIMALAGDCPCRATHTLATARVEISPDATARLIEYAAAYKKPTVVCDTNTEKYARRLGFPRIKLPGDIHADEHSTAALDVMLSNGTDALIACGSGSLHDTVRYVAYAKNIPFISYPTAASVDGFVSSVAAMTWRGQKLTYPSAAPVAVFADDAVYTDAPAKLLASGIGDMLGKTTALFDWRVSSILTGESLCERIFATEKEALELTVKAAGGDRREHAKTVMQALVLSGLAMQLCGNSRPASGAEHHLSHLWEMHLINGETSALHGEKVGVGTVLALGAYKNLTSVNAIMPLDYIFDRARLSENFGGMTDGILAENLPDGTVASSSLASLSLDEKKLHKVAALIKELPSPDEIKELIASLGGLSTLAELDLPSERSFAVRSLNCAPYVRNRLTWLKVLSASGKLC